VEENQDLRDGGETKHKTTGTALFADLRLLHNPNEVSQYTIGVNTDNIKKRTVNVSGMPMVVMEVLLLLEISNDLKHLLT
jgi:hypothetical protein